MKPIKAEISETKKKICSPVAVENLLDDTVSSAVFSTIRRLLKVYVYLSQRLLLTHFSKMNLTMTKKRCSLNSINLDALMQILF